MADEQRVHDPRVLRAIAHPVRNRILGELAAGGPMRAADIARELDIPANQASFHLRQLAKYGLVEEDPDAARDRRDRVWREAPGGRLAVSFSELATEPGGPAAVDVFRSHTATWARLLVDRALGPHEKGTGVHTVMEQTVRLTDAEAEQMRRELADLVEGWADRTRGRDDDRRTYVALQVLLPYPDLEQG
ncbi:winged helix-turn-helix domain-containing protein [Nocardioides sp. GCM10027113]|uniref:winged helix-turn-helix domain-containing protein n=1 Tax=unclassified Nocardioides TaxID=2615069 RepID=UPI003615CE65